MPELRIASYNIHRCYGMDGQYQPERVRRVLHELDAQVIALQEVESHLNPGIRADFYPSSHPGPYARLQPVSHHGELLEFLVENGPWQCIEGPTLLQEAGRYGNAILTSLPIEKYELLDLSYKDREPRGAIDISLKYRQKSLRVIATHLGLLPSERRNQTRYLLDWIGNPENDSGDITMLMGDLNEWFLWGRPLRWLRSWFGTVKAPATYSTRWPLLSLDRIWVNPKKFIVKIESHRSSLAKLASDHFPVVVTLDFDS